VRRAGLLRLGEDKHFLCHSKIQAIFAFDMAMYDFRIMYCYCHFVNTYINPGNRKVIKKSPPLFAISIQEFESPKSVLNTW